MRELVITDPALVQSPRVDFARIMGAVVGEGNGTAVRAWMDSWSECRAKKPSRPR